MATERRIWIAILLAAALLCGCGKKAPAPEGTEHTAPAESVGTTVALACCDGNITLRFHRDDSGAWRWTDDLTFPLDGKYVDELLAAAGTLELLTPIATPGDPEDYGLDRPSKYLTLSGNDGTEVTWHFGDRTESNDWYAYPGGDTTHICAAPAKLLNLMSRSIYDMALLPRLPALTEDMLRTVTVTSGETEERFTVSGGLWTRDGQDVTDAERTQRLAAALAAPAVTQCLDYAPSAGAAAVCGLAPPAATLRVEYVNSVGVDSVFTLSVGNFRETEDACCVTVGEDTTIYLMGGDLPALLTGR